MTRTVRPTSFSQMSPEQRADLRERFITAVAEHYRLPKRVLSGDTGPVTAEQARDMERFYEFMLGARRGPIRRRPTRGHS